jgi:hypothetical protein
VIFAVASLWWVALRAQAAGSEWMMDAGASMLRYARARHVDGPRRVRVNGVALQLISGSTDDGLSAVLDAFDRRCRAVGRGFGPPGALARAAGLPEWVPVVREELGDRGYLGCLDPGARELSLDELAMRLRAFARTGDLAEVGDLRFVFALRDGARTSYVGLYTEGALPLTRLFPAQGDAPGVDPDGLPRPPASRRLLSASVEGAAPLLVSYRSPLPPARIEAQYRGRLIDGGFAVRSATPPAEAARGAVHALVVEQAQSRRRALVVVTGIGRGESAVTLLPLP